jgi:hypothetical protein
LLRASRESAHEKFEASRVNNPNAICAECGHARHLHEEKYGCDHERDRWVTGHDGTEGLVAVRCGCETFVEGDEDDLPFDPNYQPPAELTAAGSYEVSAIAADLDGWNRR